MWKFINLAILFLTAIVAAAQLFSWYPSLPNPMPSHFDADGNVNGTMGRATFVGLIAGLHVLMLLGFPLLGKVLKFMPDSTINIANKDYWLTPIRRQASLDKMSGLLVACGWLTSWLLIVMFWLTSLVAVEARQGINPDFVVAMIFYSAAIFGVVAISIWQFRLPADIEPADIEPAKVGPSKNNTLEEPA